jgi:hypothetical protein
MSKLPELLQYNLRELIKAFKPSSPRTVNYFYFGILQICTEEWRQIKENRYSMEMEHGGLLVENPVTLDSVIREYLEEQIESMSSIRLVSAPVANEEKVRFKVGAYPEQNSRRRPAFNVSALDSRRASLTAIFAAEGNRFANIALIANSFCQESYSEQQQVFNRSSE